MNMLHYTVEKWNPKKI